MSLPETKVDVTDGALGVVGETIDGVHVKMGVSSLGSVNQLYSFNDPTTLVATLGHGPLVEAAAHSLVIAGGPVLCMPLNPSVAGTISAITPTRVGTSTGTVADNSSAPNDTYDVAIVITRTGTLGTAAFKYSVDGQDTFSGEIAVPSSGSYTLADTGISITFAPGAGPTFFEKDDSFAFTTVAPGYSTTDVVNAFNALLASPTQWEFVHLVGTPQPQNSGVSKTNVSGPVITLSGTPLGFYDVIIQITTTGTQTSAVLKYSLDGGANYTTGVAAAATVLLGSTGITLHLPAGTYTMGDQYTFNTYTALTALASTLSTEITLALSTFFRYAFVVMEASDAPDAILETAFADFADKRITVATGFEEVSSSVSGEVEKRPAAWPFTARLALIPVSEDPAQIDRGPLPGISKLYRDEFVTQALDAQRFTTLRTVVGKQGFYVTNGKTMAPTGSDFDLIQNLRVMNKACRAGRARLLNYQSKSLKVDKDTGFLDEATARTIDADVTRAIRDELGDDISDVTVATNRTDNILSTRKLRASIRVVPLAYAKEIEAEIGFSNPSTTKV